MLPSISRRDREHGPYTETYQHSDNDGLARKRAVDREVDKTQHDVSEHEGAQGAKPQLPGSSSRTESGACKEEPGYEKSLCTCPRHTCG
jgi:hypothetical protein